MGSQLVDLAWQALATDITGCSHQNQIGYGQFLGHQRGVFQGAADAQCKVEALSHQINKTVLAGQVYPDLGVALLEPGQPIAQLQRPDHQRHADTQSP